MRIADMNWMQVRDHAAKDDRAVLPIGSTEQHAYLSLAVDAILSERVSVEAAEPLAVPVFPVINYGLTPNFVEYPGTVTLGSTLCAVVTDVLNGIVRSGFKRIVIVNGHGGNTPAHGAVLEWLGSHRGCQVKWHNWWNAPKTWAKVQAIDPKALHAS
jgi:creatinine amidohydrolase